MTCSNAMDVGAPSNFERIVHLYEQNTDLLRKDLRSYCYTDTETLNEINTCFEKNNYLLDPHGAVGKMALASDIKKGELGMFIETAHPQKFSEVIVKSIPNYKHKPVDLEGCTQLEMANSYEAFRELILNDEF